MLGVVGSPSRSVLSGQQSLPQCRVWSAGLPDCREWLACPPGVSGVVSRPSQRVGRGWQVPRSVGSDRQSLLQSGVVRMPSRSVGSGR